jgi:hypothetical protein
MRGAGAPSGITFGRGAGGVRLAQGSNGGSPLPVTLRSTQGARMTLSIAMRAYGNPAFARPSANAPLAGPMGGDGRSHGRDRRAIHARAEERDPVLSQNVLRSPRADGGEVSAEVTELLAQPVSCNFEPSLCPHSTDIGNWRPETGGSPDVA